MYKTFIKKMENTYKVTYFDANARAANLRAILDYSKAKWEDTIVSQEEWPTLKASGKIESGQLPILEVNGKQFSQALAMEIYLAKQFNLIGSNAEDEYQITNLLCSREDYLKSIYPVLVPTEDQKNRRDAFCGKISVCNNLYQYGIKYSLTK